MFLVRTYLFIIFPFLSDHNPVYLFNTEDNDNVEYYDCMLLNTVPYCRQPAIPLNLSRNHLNSSCYHQGVHRTFAKLRNSSKNSREILHQFRSSIEKAEEYALYLSGHGKSQVICECRKAGFGKNCEYQLLVEGHFPTFENSRKWQDDQRRKFRFSIHAFQKTLCYESLQCNSGLLCLDWRDICNGRQECFNGIDEDLCDFLEFNECEIDEYRCSNGMCIPNEYFLDGEYDCMDSSDERHLFKSNECGYQSDTFDCDERLCSRSEWSCGDGQCIDEIHRYNWKESVVTSDRQCFSMREYLFMCELSNDYQLWTLIDGRCYHSSVISIDEKRQANNNCIYLVKCALSNGTEKNCPCQRNNCSEEIKKYCPAEIQYPSEGILTPYLNAYYTRDRIWSGIKQPDYYMLNGSIKCFGYQAQIDVNISISFENLSLWRHVALDTIFCEHENISKNFTGSQFHSLCYSNESHVLGKDLPYAFRNLCNQCISQYRIRDGIKDCIKGEDELLQETNFCPNHLSPYRYHCLSDRTTCLIVNTLGDSITHCNDSDDEFIHGIGQPLSLIKCQNRSDDDCLFLRQYISNSKSDRENKNQKETMHFQICQSWKCSQDEYQCRTGQCIPKHFVCDNEWDCFDASDELFYTNNFSIHNQRIQFKEEQLKCALNTKQEPQLFDGLCNLTKEYPCVVIDLT
ncbi:hypothetical protein I4U23_023182 [Adineta vaga]|nr:hypothetical protein I4U23_023182 [Adineta vaga]